MGLGLAIPWVRRTPRPAAQTEDDGVTSTQVRVGCVCWAGAVLGCAKTRPWLLQVCVCVQAHGRPTAASSTATRPQGEATAMRAKKGRGLSSSVRGTGQLSKRRVADKGKARPLASSRQQCGEIAVRWLSTHVCRVSAPAWTGLRGGERDDSKGSSARCRKQRHLQRETHSSMARTQRRRR